MNTMTMNATIYGGSAYINSDTRQDHSHIFYLQESEGDNARGFSLVKISTTSDVIDSLPADFSAYPVNCKIDFIIKRGGGSKGVQHVTGLTVVPDSPVKPSAKSS